jgi:hypothetical protein
MFQIPMMNRRQQQALAQSAIMKINLYKQKLALEQQKQIVEQQVEANTNQSLAEFKRRTEFKRREQMKKLVSTVVQESTVSTDSTVVQESTVSTVVQESSDSTDSTVVQESSDSTVVQESTTTELQVDEPIVFTITEEEDQQDADITEIKDEIIEAIEEQTKIESALVTQTMELKEEFLAEFAGAQEEISLQVVDEDEEITSL